ncbi:hypothetical protein JNK13_04755 [bacterium]|nr:hypothetical protein [bacterium]
MIPQNYELVFSKSQIHASVHTLAETIRPWANRVLHRTNHAPLALTVLRGGVFFAADFLRELGVSCELSFIGAKSYSQLDNSQAPVVELSKFEAEIKDRGVIVLDDICESGKTFAAISQLLKSKQAFDVRTIALILRDTGKERVFEPDYGLTFHGPDWLVGYGLDDCNENSNLPEIYRIKS